MSATWKFSPAPELGLVHEVVRELGLPPLLAPLLARAGFADRAALLRYLQPRLRDLDDPNRLAGIAEAVARLFRAVDGGERVVLYGDYDVDGVTSVALLTRVLRAYGVEPGRFLPHRVDEGYGLSREGIARCLEEHRPRLLVALDCGTSSAGLIAELEASGVDLIVLDHHEAKRDLPKCTAFVNPKVSGEYRYLCTVGVVFKLCHALLKARPVAGFDLKESLDLVALGTVADLVPLVEENRTLVAHGLRQLERTRWVGLQALTRVAGVAPPIRPVHVGYRLGPRLNAAGRLGVALDALDLLLSEDLAQAERLAHALDAQNRERQEIEEATLREALALALADGDPSERAAIVVGAAGWHPGVVGIVASRLMRRFHRPTLVIGFDQDGLGKGSGRSIPGFSLVNGLERCAEHLGAFGGHEMAAGLSLAQENLGRLRDSFYAVAREVLTPEQLLPCIEVTAAMGGWDVDEALWQAHEMLQPFGMGNPQPLLCLPRVSPVEPPRLLKEKHRLLHLRHGRRVLRAIHFNGAEVPLPTPPWDVAFYLERNEYQGTVRPQVQVEAIRTAQ